MISSYLLLFEELELNAAFERKDEPDEPVGALGA